MYEWIIISVHSLFYECVRLVHLFLFTERYGINVNFLFFLNSVMLGVGLAMDAFSVSLTNGLGEPRMSRRRMCMISSVYSVFQAVMPLIGWICVHTILGYFSFFSKCIPWIALILLVFIGGKMLIEGLISKEDGKNGTKRISFGVLILQGIATSIDALSVGFTIAEYGFAEALISALIIAAVTFIICLAGLAIGKKFGTFLSNKAAVFGGVILIAIGIEIFIKGII